ncbi:MAG: prepilin peptidase [Candidatus Poribacteria bacterium]|nr:prepilin peptidase [Candidatus Poribacteria bacterium]
MRLEALKFISLYETFTILITLSCCFYASYTDIKFRKVYNACSFGLIGLGLFNQAFLILLGECVILDAVFFVLGGFLMSYLIYLVGIWAPGDSKLFLGAALVLPNSVFENFTGLGNFPMLGVLINIFLPYFLFTMFLILYKLLKGELKIDFKIKQVSSDIAKLIYNIFSFMGLGYLLFYPIQHFNLQVNNFLIILLFLGFLVLFGKLIKKYHLEDYQMLILSPLLFVTVFLISPPLTRVINIIIVSIVMYFLFKIFVHDLGQSSFIEEVEISELKPGVVLAEKIVEVEHKKYEKREGIFSSHFAKGILVGPTPEGLSIQKIEELKQLCQNGYFKTFGNKIKIQHSIGFAPFITLGILLTMISKGAIHRFFLF